MSIFLERLRSFEIHEETPVDSIMGNIPMEIIHRELADLLREFESDQIHAFLRFVRDSVNYTHSRRDEFIEALSNSMVCASIESLLQVPVYHVRGGTVYTLGKIGARRGGEMLRDRFRWFLERDPLNLPGLVFELSWLEKTLDWGLVDEILVAPHFLQRWSLCEILDHELSNDDVGCAKSRLEILARDSSPRIADEARFLLKESEKPRPTELPVDFGTPEVESIHQPLLFHFAGNEFMRDRRDYVIEELERFIASKP